MKKRNLSERMKMLILLLAADQVEKQIWLHEVESVSMTLLLNVTASDDPILVA